MSCYTYMHKLQGGATHVDIACDQELVKLAMNLTSLPVNSYISFGKLRYSYYKQQWPVKNISSIRAQISAEVANLLRCNALTPYNFSTISSFFLYFLYSLFDSAYSYAMNIEVLKVIFLLFFGVTFSTLSSTFINY